MNINPETYDAYQLLHNGTLAFSRAEQQGIRIDIDYCEETKKKLTKRIEKLENELFETSFYRHWSHSIGGKKPNIYSNTQLSSFLYKVKKLEPVYNTKSGQGATDEDALNELDVPELKIILKARKLKKVRDTYLEAFTREQVNGYIHPSFNLHLVKTFRSSSDSPNFQNIPKRDEESMRIVRGALYPRPGHLLLEADYSGLEVRIAACFHKDPTMLKYIKDPTTDMHGDMAKQLFFLDSYDPSKHKVLRNATKNGFVFPQFYGSYYKNCAIGLATGWCKMPRAGKWKATDGILIKDEPLGTHFHRNGITSMKKYINHVKEIEADFWNVRFPQYTRWKEKWWKEYQRKGYFFLKTGFCCSGVMSRNDVINYPVQGSAFHCNLWAFTKLDNHIQENKMDSKIIGQIHDSIVMDVHPDELPKICEIIKRITCKDLPKAWSWINVPLDVEIDIGSVDASWVEMNKMKD